MPMLLVSGIISVICCGMLYFTFSFAENADTFFAAIFVVGSFYVMGVTAVVVLQAVISVFALVRYYKSLFTDEGYLTMVLPMESTTLINGKILFTLIWWAISTVSLILGIFISVALPIMLYDGTIFAALFQSVEGILGVLIKPEHSTFIGILNVLSVIVRFVENTILTVAAITVGATVIKKRRLLGAFLFYFGISFIRENVISVFEALIDLILVASTNTSIGAVLSLVFGILVSAGIGIASYFVMCRIFTKKFNIE
jgi:hypothetical protein